MRLVFRLHLKIYSSSRLCKNKNKLTAALLNAPRIAVNKLIGNAAVIAVTKLMAGSLTRGITQSCGCLSKEKARQRRLKHNMTGTKIYKAWTEMKRRCSNPNCDAYARYGGRGIKVCKEWSESFQAFYDYVSTLPHFGEKGYSLDRIDDNGNYEPCNVRYASAKDQARNTRRNITVEYNGEQMTLSQAAELSGIKVQTLWRRYKHGDTDENLFRPVI